jgi:hypothetical protein
MVAKRAKREPRFSMNWPASVKGLASSPRPSPPEEEREQAADGRALLQRGYFNREWTLMNANEDRKLETRMTGIANYCESKMIFSREG